jgi:hypothetical protein
MNSPVTPSRALPSKRQILKHSEHLNDDNTPAKETGAMSAGSNLDPATGYPN